MSPRNSAAVSEPDVFPRLEALAAIGDGRSMALLGPDSRVEWFCPERFDAAPAVWPLLDRGRGGHLHIAPVSCLCTAVTYVPGTAVLRYEWQGRLGRGRTSVAMLWPPQEGGQELLWLIECLIARPWTYEKDPRGHLGVLADRDRRVLLGAGAVGPQASAWIHKAALAVREEIPIDRLLDQVAQFPTYTEGYLKALQKLDL
jgi:hypothetical protein